MIDFPHLKDICQSTKSKIIMLVVDGLGGLADPNTGKSELQMANIPNLDKLASMSACGLTTPVLPGITPGSGPGHLALFGYDPITYLIGRGVLEALGIGVDLKKGDIAARGNFCTVDSSGDLVDRRAGRIKTEESGPLCQILDKIDIPDLDIQILPVQDYRFVTLFRGTGLKSNVTETDPQRLGVPPRKVEAVDKQSAKTSDAANALVNYASHVLGNRDNANGILLRGFSELPELPDFGVGYQLDPAAIAAYPMYRGLAKVAGMTVIPTGPNFKAELETMTLNYANHDFFYIHYKPADAAGEDGDFQAMVVALEELDKLIPDLVALKPETLVIAGDHSTPSILGGHGWQPVPLLVNSRYTPGEGVHSFDEYAFRYGSLGIIKATEVMLLALAHADKLIKFGP